MSKNGHSLPKAWWIPCPSATVSVQIGHHLRDCCGLTDGDQWDRSHELLTNRPPRFFLICAIMGAFNHTKGFAPLYPYPWWNGKKSPED